jgi:hypothetical protein
MENSEDASGNSPKKKYRPRLSSAGKAFIKMQKHIIIIWRDYNDIRAELADGGVLLCSDPICDLAEWIDKNIMMYTHKGYIVGFGFVEDVLPDKEKLKLKMARGLFAIVTREQKIEFNSRYEFYCKTIR